MIDADAVEELVNVLEGRQQAPDIGNIIRFPLAIRALHEGIPLVEIVQCARVDLEKRLIRCILASTQGNKSEAARVLKIDYKTLYRKLRKYADSSILHQDSMHTVQPDS